MLWIHLLNQNIVFVIKAIKIIVIAIFKNNDTCQIYLFTWTLLFVWPSWFPQIELDLTWLEWNAIILYGYILASSEFYLTGYGAKRPFMNNLVEIIKFAGSTLFELLCICLFRRGRNHGHFFLMNVDVNHVVDARTSQWLPFSMRWPNEKIYLVGIIIFENCNN